ncbi:MAG: hypothetical protein KA354_03045 [Phycisphaerae bacterium]|nr:hypothetical protein [Phycisphaerae bacterium]
MPATVTGSGVLDNDRLIGEGGCPAATLCLGEPLRRAIARQVGLRELMPAVLSWGSTASHLESHRQGRNEPLAPRLVPREMVVGLVTLTAASTRGA